MQKMYSVENKTVLSLNTLPISYQSLTYSLVCLIFQKPEVTPVELELFGVKTKTKIHDLRFLVIIYCARDKITYFLKLAIFFSFLECIQCFQYGYCFYINVASSHYFPSEI